jgi:hypothetical protein
MTLNPSPAPRWAHSLSELPSTLSSAVSGVSTGIANQVVMFGGKTTAAQYNGIASYNGILGDYWALLYYPSTYTPSGFGATGASGTSALHWQYLGGGSNPVGTGCPARFDHAASFDGKYVTVVGGVGTLNQSVPLSDTWSLLPNAGTTNLGIPSETSGNWIQQPLTNSISGSGTYAIPTTIRAASMSYNPVAPTGPVLYGGGIAYKNVGYSNDQWTYSASGVPGAYTMVSNPNTSSGAPSAREYASQATDTLGNTILWGGRNANGSLSDLWLYTTSAGWSQITGPNSGGTFTPGVNAPPAKYAASFAYNTSNSTFVLYGGITLAGQYDYSTWTFSVSSNAWTLQTLGTPGQVPAPLAYAAMANFSAASGVVMFGGLNSYGCSNQTYLLTGGPSGTATGAFWTQQ